MLSEKVSKELEKYEGMWVAVTADKVVAHGKSAKEVHDEARKKTRIEVSIFKVPTKDEEAHVL